MQSDDPSIYCISLKKCKENSLRLGSFFRKKVYLYTSPFWTLFLFLFYIFPLRQKNEYVKLHVSTWKNWRGDQCHYVLSAFARPSSCQNLKTLPYLPQTREIKVAPAVRSLAVTNNSFILDNLPPFNWKVDHCMYYPSKAVAAWAVLAAAALMAVAATVAAAAAGGRGGLGGGRGNSSWGGSWSSRAAAGAVTMASVAVLEAATAAAKAAIVAVAAAVVVAATEAAAMGAAARAVATTPAAVLEVAMAAA
jgi:hypothetical protein